jgi:predicted transposase YdaD
LQSTTDKIIVNERLELMEAILVNRFPQLNLEAIQAMLNIITTNDLRHTRFYRDVFREGEAELILRLLARRCGTLSAPQKSRIMALPKEKLDALGDALLDFTDMADLEAWLKPLN